MRSRPDEMSFRAPLATDVPAWSMSRSQPDSAQAAINLERDCEVTIEMDLDGPHPVVSVIGLLGHSGGALLAAVLEYVRERAVKPSLWTCAASPRLIATGWRRS